MTGSVRVGPAFRQSLIEDIDPVEPTGGTSSSMMRRTANAIIAAKLRMCSQSQDEPI